MSRISIPAKTDDGQDITSITYAGEARPVTDGVVEIDDDLVPAFLDSYPGSTPVPAPAVPETAAPADTPSEAAAPVADSATDPAAEDASAPDDTTDTKAPRGRRKAADTETPETA